MFASTHVLQLPELVSQVFDYIDHRPTFVAACQVCKLWYAYANPKLWHGAIRYWDSAASRHPSNLLSDDFVAPSSCQLLGLYQKLDGASFANSVARIRFHTQWCDCHDNSGIREHLCNSAKALVDQRAFRLMKPRAIRYHQKELPWVDWERRKGSSAPLTQMLSAELLYLDCINWDPCNYELLESVAEHCPRLQSLTYSLRNAQYLEARQNVKALSRLSSLTHIVLSGNPTGDSSGAIAFIEALAQLPALKCLRFMSLRDCKPRPRWSPVCLKDGHVASSDVTRFPQLRALSSDHWTFIALIAHLTRLQTLIYRGDYYVAPLSEQPILALASHCQDLRRVGINYQYALLIDAQTFTKAILADLSCLSDCGKMRVIRINCEGPTHNYSEPKHVRLESSLPDILSPWPLLEQFRFDGPMMLSLRAQELFHISRNNSYLYQLAVPTDFDFLELADLEEEAQMPMLRYFSLHDFNYPGGRRPYGKLINQYLPALEETWLIHQPRGKNARRRWKKIDSHIKSRVPRKQWRVSPLEHYTTCSREEFDRVLQQIAGEAVPDRQYLYPPSNHFWSGI